MQDRPREDAGDRPISDQTLVDLAVAKAIVEIENRRSASSSAKWQRDAALLGAALAILGGLVSYIIHSTERRLEDQISSEVVSSETRLKENIISVIDKRFVDLQDETSREMRSRLEVYEKELGIQTKHNIDGISNQVVALRKDFSSLERTQRASETKEQFLVAAREVYDGEGFSNGEAETALQLLTKLSELNPESFIDLETNKSCIDMITTFISAGRVDFAERGVDIMGDSAAMKSSKLIVALLVHVTDRLLADYPNPGEWPETDMEKLNHYAEAARTVNYPEYAIVFTSVVKFRRNGDIKSPETIRILEELYDIQDGEAGYVVFQYFYRSTRGLSTSEEVPRRRDQRIAETYDGFWKAHKEELRRLLESKPDVERNFLGRIDKEQMALFSPMICEAFGKMCQTL